MLLLLIQLLACDSPSVLDAPTATRTERPARQAPTAIPLARQAHAAEEITIPDSSRPGGARAPTTFGPTEPFAFVGSYDGADVYKTPLPLHSNLLPDKLRGTHTFGSAAPTGLIVRGPEGIWPFERGARRIRSYGFDRSWLYVGVAAGGEAPESTEFFVSFKKAADHEDALNRKTFEGTDEAFVSRNLTLDSVSTTGLYLPAPGRASWRLTVPDQGVFTTRVQVVPPAIRSATQSDGATLVLEVLDGEAVVQTASVDAVVGLWTDVRWDLAEHGGQDRTVRLRTEPGDSADYDYVFLEEPTLYTPKSDPERTVLVFVDTLRPDHLGTYGYARATSPFIDRWATHAAVFEQARSVAPWTLPSARAALSGHQPEAWFDVENLAERFGDAGYATEAIVSNAFLSQPFDMHRGWSRFQYGHLNPATDVSKLGVDILARHADRDLLLLVHYMDPHLPYEEGLKYRYRWVIRSPDGLAPGRGRLYEAELVGDEQAAMKRYVEGRYDQNIRYVDDELRSVLEAAGPDATTVLFSDHGEEFWDHGSFEHGHSFYDELLHVPFVIRSPHAPPGRYTDPVSLLDLAPTVLELAGLEPTDGPGRSLVGRMYGVAGEAEALADRPQGFGRPLYEQDGWAVLEDGKKWVDRGGVRTLYDLGADPGESANVASSHDLSAYPEALADSLDREVHAVWRVRPKTRKAHGGVQIRIEHPLGIREAWASYDPRGKSADVTIAVVDGEVRIDQPASAEMPNAIFLVPAGNWRVPRGLAIDATATGHPRLQGTSSVEQIPDGPDRNVLLEVGEKGWSFAVDTAFVPERSGVEVSGFHSDVEAQLEELGYVEEKGKAPEDGD